jgi:transcriptional regulator with XRE-family HTH domain
MNNPAQTGQIIRQRRKDLGLSQSQLADKLNVQNTTISRWETGEGYPDISILLELTKVLKVRIGDLLDSPDHENYLGQSIQSFYRAKNYSIQILMTILKSFLVLIPIGIHVFLYWLSLGTTYVSIGTLRWIPFMIQSSVLIFFAMMIVYDKFLYKILNVVINNHTIRLDNGMLAPRFRLILTINIILLILSLIIII